MLGAMVAAVTIAGAVTGEHVAWAAIFNGFAYAGYEWLNAITLWRAARPETAARAARGGPVLPVHGHRAAGARHRAAAASASRA